MGGGGGGGGGGGKRWRAVFDSYDYDNRYRYFARFLLRGTGFPPNVFLDSNSPEWS